VSPRGAAPRRSSSATEKNAKILVLSGPNLDRLGTREPHIYGSTTLSEIHHGLAVVAKQHGASVDCRHSNHEGDLVTWIGKADGEGFTGMLINAGAYTHTSYALHDAIKGSPLPVVEVHISNPEAREAFRHVSVIAAACVAKVAGFGPDSYRTALEALLRRLSQKTG
jgi:3-dehydroquinate dehydratase II